MQRRVNEDQPQTKRPYHAPRRTAAAAETRQAILRAAKEDFEARGWAATTIRSIADGAGVSPKTVEALFTNKPALLEATLLAAASSRPANSDAADVSVLRPEAVLEIQGEAALEIEGAPDAATMLELHSALVREINTRAARLLWAVETAVPSDEHLAELWVRLTNAQLFAVQWSAEVLFQKPGVRAGLTRREAEETFLIAMDWKTFRTLTTEGELTPEAVQRWIIRFYRGMLLP